MARLFFITRFNNVLLDVGADTGVDVEDVVADKPDEVGEVGHSRLVDDEAQHRLLLSAIHVERQRPDCDAYHALWVVEELDGLRVEREVVGVLRKSGGNRLYPKKDSFSYLIILLN